MTDEPAETNDPDGRYIVVDGRQWRATDPTIPPALRGELVSTLMAARREVGAARRTGDRDAEHAARTRVHDAKVALGERGEPWWDDATEDGRRARLTSAMLTLLRSRDEASSICPSDAARAIGATTWRSLVPVAREVAGALVVDGVVEVTQRGQPVDAADAKGPVRIRRGPRFA